MRRVCGSSVCSSSASGVHSAAARSALSRPCRAKNDQMRAQPSAIVTTLPPVRLAGDRVGRAAGPASSEPRNVSPVGAAKCGLPGELAVADDDDAAVPFGADEPPDGLPQLQRGQRQVVRLAWRLRPDPRRRAASARVCDGGAARLDDRGGERGERQLVDPHQPQPLLVGDVDALPQSFGADEEAAAVLDVGELRRTPRLLPSTSADSTGVSSPRAAARSPGSRRCHRRWSGRW